MDKLIDAVKQTNDALLSILTKLEKLSPNGVNFTFMFDFSFESQYEIQKTLLSTLEKLVNKAMHQIDGYRTEDREVSNILAKVLQYSKGVPGDPEEYAIGDHTSVSLAMEIADRVSTLSGS